jgi:3,4-dihydroxy 2-butanone 4-phosphate synthase/GTP cyclohydrolase II
MKEGRTLSLRPGPLEAARISLPTEAGEFEARAFETPTGSTHLALVRGDIGGTGPVLVRLHSECLTGDALGSRRCDCGVQLSMSLRAIAAEGRGVLLYATGHEGRGIGLVNKLRAYRLQDVGADTVAANKRLGLPADGRDYSEAVSVIRALGVRSVRLLTNNPAKVDAVRAGGIDVEEVLPLPVSPHLRNVHYLRTKERRMGHRSPGGADVDPGADPLGIRAIDATALLGPGRSPDWRPFVVVKYAQTLDGRIATAAGDSKWISGSEERRLSHALRAACDAVLVGIGTVSSDDPQLTVRLVPGASPVRVVLDTALRIPDQAQVLDEAAWTVVVTTDRSSPARRLELQSRGVAVPVMRRSPAGVDLVAALRWLQGSGVRSVLVEGGSRVITSMLQGGLVDRLIVSVAPTVIGAGREAVGDLGVTRVSDGFHLDEPRVHRIGQDVVISGNVRYGDAEPSEEAAGQGPV